MVIGNGKGPALSQLTTMAAHRFVIDGVCCASIESFIQALKFDKPSQQASVCADRAKDAKERGKKAAGWVNGGVHWKGQPMDRHSQEYGHFIEYVVSQVAAQCPSFAQALLEVPEDQLTSPGRSKELETPVTEAEYCQALVKARNGLARKARAAAKPAV